MSVVFSSNGLKSLQLRPTFSRVFGVFFYTTKTQTSIPPIDKKDTLYKRISPLGNPRVSIVPILDQWVQEGKPAKPKYLKDMIHELRKYRRYSHALEISHWMTDRRYVDLSPGDVAIRLDLISKVHGIEQAEEYFTNVPKQFKVFKLYNCLLNCYVHKKIIEKAEALMQKMRDMGYLESSAYNALLNLYFQVGQYEKIDNLMEEMKEMGVTPDKFTFRTLLSTYAATSDIDGMEKTIQLMEVDPNIIIDWNSYSIAANGYIKSGLIDKAFKKLQKLEEIIPNKEMRSARDILLSLYGAAGRKEDLYRIWNLCKSFGKAYNSSYSCMIVCLLKMDDIAGAEKILEEWEAGHSSFDFRVRNRLISAYCNNGLLEKAELLINKAIEKGEKPYPNTWDILASGYIKANKMPKAVEAMKAAFLASKPGWKPYRDNLAACLVYLKQQGDVEKTEELLRLLGGPGYMSTDVCERVMDCFYTSKRVEPVEASEVESNDSIVEETNQNTNEGT
ncbi:hypothetical protein AQUCO_00800211v1 [Aquilegia coerulea]|uniref:Pentacotripeptide-repeat region of PRORP domain-containing protein n=1 Tax=Aquilegia coerulea TaxID=218851 RepID=A0A2G5EHT5_AQUCA|nr:hypothetical protein AQUCO_00800211v1 [Aquilegia coerulea]